MWIFDHFQRIPHVTGENFLLEGLEVLAVDGVLPLAPRRSTLASLEAPVDRKSRRQNLELVSRDVHLVDL